MVRFRAPGLLVFAFALGCSSSDMPPLASAGGKLTLADGTPVTRVTVVFTPDPSKGSQGPVAACSVDATGRYSVRTAGQHTGAPVGHHIVTIEPEYHPELPASELVKIPAKYQDRKTSPLRAEVVAGKDNVLDFKLTP